MLEWFSESNLIAEGDLIRVIWLVSGEYFARALSLSASVEIQTPRGPRTPFLLKLFYQIFS